LERCAPADNNYGINDHAPCYHGGRLLDAFADDVRQHNDEHDDNLSAPC
jgi:hypothetical protein